MAGGATGLLNGAALRQVGDVFAIPGQQVIQAVYSCNRDVQRICSSLGWESMLLDEQDRQIRRWLRHIENLHVTQHGHSFRNFLQVATPRFTHHHFRSKQLVVGALFAPPFQRNLLPCRPDQITAGAGNEIADEAGFEVDPGHK